MNGSLKINFTKVLEMGSDGVMHEYFDTDNVTVNLDAKSVILQFNNLFNGTKWLGKKTFINAVEFRTWET